MIQTRCMKCMKTYDEQYDVCPHCGYRRGEEPANPLYLPEGTVLDGKYLIGAVIGHGGFGITYVAFDQLIEKRVAIKEYFPASLSTRTIGNPTIYPFTTQDADNNYRYGREKFIEEARTLARFSNMDSIVSVLTCFMQNNTAYIVMEYLEGEDLLEYVKRRGGKIGWAETLTLLAPVMDALTALHAQGLIHRDISPDNIFITKDGKTKLLDFGTARFAMGEKSKSLSLILKPGYAPPEQYSSRGKQGSWTDVYALAATIYRCVTGQAPVDAVDRQMGTALEPPASLGANIPKIAENVLMGALALGPEKRIQTVGDLKWQLEQQKEVQPKVEQQPAAPQVHINIDGYNPAGAASNQAADHRDEEYREAMRRADEEEADIRRRRRNTLIGVGVVISVIIIALIIRGTKPKATPEETFSVQQPSVETTAAEPSAEQTDTRTDLAGTTLAISLPTTTHPWFFEVQSDIGAAAEARAVQIEFRDAETSAEMQIMQIEELIAMGVQAIAVYPVEYASIVPTLIAVRECGIIVILVGGTGDDDCYDTAIMNNTSMQGQMAAQWAAQHGAENVVEILGTFASAQSMNISEGFQEELGNNYPDVSIVYQTEGLWSTEVAISAMTDFLKTGIGFDTVFCHSFEIAYGIILAMQQAGFDTDEKLVICIYNSTEAVQAVFDGIIDCVISNSPRYGELLLDVMEALYNGDPVDTIIYVEDYLIDSINASEELANAY